MVVPRKRVHILKFQQTAKNRSGVKDSIRFMVKNLFSQFTDGPWLTIRLQISRLKIAVEHPEIAYVFRARALESVFLKAKRQRNPIPHKQNILRFA